MDSTMNLNSKNTNYPVKIKVPKEKNFNFRSSERHQVKVLPFDTVVVCVRSNELLDYQFAMDTLSN